MTAAPVLGHDLGALPWSPRRWLDHCESGVGHRRRRGAIVARRPPAPSSSAQSGASTRPGAGSGGLNRQVSPPRPSLPYSLLPQQRTAPSLLPSQTQPVGQKPPPHEGEHSRPSRVSSQSGMLQSLGEAQAQPIAPVQSLPVSAAVSADAVSAAWTAPSP